MNVQVNRGCSGTIIDRKEGLVLTAHHCIDDNYETVEKEEIADDGEVKKKKVRVLRDATVTQYVFQGSEKVQTATYVARLKAYDKDHDLGLMQVVKPSFTGEARFACQEPERGDAVSIVGNPMGVLYASAHQGIVASMQRNYQLLGVEEFGDAKAPLMQIDAGIVGGNSGGSVWNEKAEMIGVPVLGHRVNEVIGFAVPLSSIKTFLKAQGLDRLFERCDAH